MDIGSRLMPCCGKVLLPKIQRWVNGNASVVCPGCGAGHMYTPAMMRRIVPVRVESTR